MGERILVVTSHTEFGETLRLSLEEDGGYQVHYAQIANDAIQTARRQDFFLAILDAEGIDLTIQELVEGLREAIPDIHIIVIPPFNDADHPSLQGIRIDGYLNRPFFTPDLITQVRELAAQRKEREPIPKEEETAVRPKLTKDDLLRELDHFFNWMDKPLARKAEERQPEPESNADQEEEKSKQVSHGENIEESQISAEHIEIPDEEEIPLPPDEPQAAEDRMEQNLQQDWMMEDKMEEKKKPESEEEIIEDLLAQLAAQSTPESEQGEEEGKIVTTSEGLEHPPAEVDKPQETQGLTAQDLDDKGEWSQTAEISADESRLPEGTSPEESQGSWEYLEPVDEDQAIERLRQAITDQDDQYASFQLNYLVERDAFPGIVLILSEKIWAHAGVLQKTDLEEIEQILSSGHHSGENVDLARFVRFGSRNEKFLIYATTIQAGLTLCEVHHAGKPLSKIRKHTIDLARQLRVEVAEPPGEPVAVHPPETELPVSKEEEQEPAQVVEEETGETLPTDDITGMEEEPVVDHVMMGDEWVYEMPEETAPVELVEKADQVEASDQMGSVQELVAEEGSGKMKEESPTQGRYYGPKSGPKLFTNQIEPADKAPLLAFQNGQTDSMATFNQMAEPEDGGKPSRVFDAEQYADYRAQKDAVDILGNVRARLKNQRSPANKSLYLAVEAEYYQSLVGQNEIGYEIKTSAVQAAEMIQEEAEEPADLYPLLIENRVLDEALEEIAPEIEEIEAPETEEEMLPEEAIGGEDLSLEREAVQEVEAESSAEPEEGAEPQGGSEALLEEEAVMVEEEEETMEVVVPETPPSELEIDEGSIPSDLLDEQVSAAESPEAETDLEEEPELEEKESKSQLEEMLQGILEDLEMAVPPEVQLEEEQEEIQPEEEETEGPEQENVQNPEDQVRILDDELDLLEPLRNRSGKEEDLDFDIDVDTFFEEYMSEVGEPITPDEIGPLAGAEAISPTKEEQPEEGEIPPEPSDGVDSAAAEKSEPQSIDDFESLPTEEVALEETQDTSFDEGLAEGEEAAAEEEFISTEETPEDQPAVEIGEIISTGEEVGETAEAENGEVSSELEEPTEEISVTEKEENLTEEELAEAEEITGEEDFPATGELPYPEGLLEDQATSAPEEPLEEWDFIEEEETLPEEELAEAVETTGEEDPQETGELPYPEELLEDQATSAPEEPLEEWGLIEKEETLPEEEPAEPEETTAEEELVEPGEAPYREQLEEEESIVTEIGRQDEGPSLAEEQPDEDITSEDNAFLKDMKEHIKRPDKVGKGEKNLDLDEDLNALLISLNETSAEKPGSSPELDAFKPPFDLENLGDLFSEEESAEDIHAAVEETVIQEEGIEAISGDQEEAWETITEEEAAKQAEIETQRIIEDILTQPEEEMVDFPPAGHEEQAIEDLQIWDTDEHKERPGTEEDEFSATIVDREAAQPSGRMEDEAAEPPAPGDFASDQVLEEGLYPWETEVAQDNESTPTPHAGLDEAAPGGLLDLMTDLEGMPILPEKDNPTYTCILVPDLNEFSLSSEITSRLIEWMPKLCQAYGWQLEKLSIQPTYMQWTVRVTPGISQGFIVRKIRLQTSIRMFDEFPELKKDNLSGNFWAKGYLVVSGSEPPPAELLDDFIQRNSHPRDSSSPQFFES